MKRLPSFGWLWFKMSAGIFAFIVIATGAIAMAQRIHTLSQDNEGLENALAAREAHARVERQSTCSYVRQTLTVALRPLGDTDRANDQLGVDMSAPLLYFVPRCVGLRFESTIRSLNAIVLSSVTAPKSAWAAEYRAKLAEIIAGMELIGE